MMQIYIPQPVVVDGMLGFQARIPHDGTGFSLRSRLTGG